MAFSTRDARKQAMPADLREWCATAAPGDRRTLVLKLAPTADVERLTLGLHALGAEVLSAGPGATVVRVDGEAARAACELPGVVEIDAPQRLFPRGAGPATY